MTAKLEMLAAEPQEDTWFLTLGKYEPQRKAFKGQQAAQAQAGALGEDFVLSKLT